MRESPNEIMKRVKSIFNKTPEVQISNIDQEIFNKAQEAYRKINRQE